MKFFTKNKIFFINIIICILLIFTTNCEYYTLKQKYLNNYLEEKDLNNSLKQRYLEAIKFLVDKKYDKALIRFSNLYINYPYNIYNEKILVYLMYLNYINKDFLNVLELTNEFIKSYSFSAFMNYVLYIRIMSEISLDTNTEIQNFFRINRINCNPFYTKLAINDTEIFIKNYPNSIYTKYLKKKLIFMKERVEKFELSIIKFYFKKKIYIATINRCLIFLKNYPNSREINLVKKILKNSYHKINLYNK
ncbi:outer membrane protein assembly factor BamD [Enterobacteriaceae endosymbiont of Donacia sparganii]|uniref:outer membrane protein assembly factor BamD n=1 Tax=Enterobacteriaceae endosymbiont of Donacia sparganii TaxID=2675785 RepID=UPI001448EE0B|nr:outer membrane protein assembly factor BamD [Enterobacteriaceae endosymbiont of Donacia sparganii]QJC35849.1 outer membrane protein assembly factor BamD [Enterobacteriaceae endosymbiont of Donacia sparganii]